MTTKLTAGQRFQPIGLKNIHGSKVPVPDFGEKWVHLQLRRFAGCPVCNLHLQEFVRRHAEIAKAGIREVVVFHSAPSELIPYQGRFPFDVVGDPEKKLYRR
ncbi:redoxin domain-containing protein [Bradyrhizobium sp. 139]|uniref:redoxin domain-containing protein n=1 Tax=Bradyrhizobium sp. 139 TaxID=2782616 RepID=UPI001FFB5EF2|nr:redoxin domain-containing protein [Bradyrhizobium sp. 139]